MNKLSNTLKEISFYFCPILKDILYYDSPISISTWQADVETGKGLEIASLCATIFAFQKLGYSLSLPTLYENNPDLFYLRNVIPRHHDAQPGHDVVFINQVSLQDRFIASLTPKAILRSAEGLTFSIFREGHPVHKISHLLKTNNEYLDRPDIVISQGEMFLPDISNKEVAFSYIQNIGNISGRLRIKNDIRIPIISYESEINSDVLVNGIIECSVGKGQSHAVKQVNRYKSLFASAIMPTALLVSGQKYAGNHIDHEIFIGLKDFDAEKITNALKFGVDSFIKDIVTAFKMT